MGDVMSSNWIEGNEKTLEELRKLKEKRDMDRLDLLKSMRFSLWVLSQSLRGWMQWVNSPEVMSQFTGEELQEMNDRIIDMVSGFIEYDLEATDLGVKKGLDKERSENQSRFVI